MSAFGNKQSLYLEDSGSWGISDTHFEGLMPISWDPAQRQQFEK